MAYGYLAIFGAVSVETMGIPFPGETALLAGAVYAGTGGQINIVFVIAAAAAGAILGDNVGYTFGRLGGYPLLVRLARLFHLDPAKLSYSQRFFAQHGDKTVLIGRFFALLRVWVAFLAGANRMPRRSFFFWNATGGILWATVFGTLGYTLGHNLPLLEKILQTMGIAGAILSGAVVVAVLIAWLVARRRTHARVLAAQVRPLPQADAQSRAGAGLPTPPGEMPGSGTALTRLVSTDGRQERVSALPRRRKARVSAAPRTRAPR